MINPTTVEVHTYYSDVVCSITVKVLQYYGRGKKKKQSSDTQMCFFSFWTFSLIFDFG